MKSILKLVGLPILATILACRPPSMEATAQDPAQRAQSLEQQLIRAQQSTLELKDALHKVAQELAAEKAASRVAIVKLETENAELKRLCEHMEKELVERVQSEADALAALRAAQGHASTLTKERGRMRAEQAAKPPATPGAAAPFGVTPAPEPDAPSVSKPPAPDHDPFGSRPARPDAK